jgi:hypothetical protein
MDLDLEKDRLLQIFGKKFDASIEDSTYIVIKDEYDSYCTMLRINGYELHIEVINRCTISGKDILEMIIKFAIQGNYKKIIASDFSKLIFSFNSVNYDNRYKKQKMQPIEIDLWMLHLLRDGNTWYQKFGFTNPQLMKYETQINKFISKNIFDFFELYDITFFTGMYGFDQNITISGFIKFIDEELKEKCPNLECIDNIDTLELVKESLNIIEKLYKSLLEELHITYLPHEIVLDLPLQYFKSKTTKSKTTKSKTTKSKTTKSKTKSKTTKSKTTKSKTKKSKTKKSKTTKSKTTKSKTTKSK